MRVRVQISIDADSLAAIDAAAQDAGESRSEYMCRAALGRSGEHGFTDAQEARIVELAQGAS